MLSIVVPCYNEKENISNLVQAFQEVNDYLDQGRFELILVDNGSRDGTGEQIDKLQSEFEFIRKVTVEDNQGYGYGILKGLEMSCGEWLGWIHADLQIHPHAIIEIIKKTDIEKKLQNTFLKGRRKKRPFIDAFFTWGMSVFESLYLHAWLYDINAQPTIFNRTLLEKMKNPPHDFSLDLYIYFLACKNNFKIVRVPVIQRTRMEGESSWNTGILARIKLIKRTLSYSRKLKKQLN